MTDALRNNLNTLASMKRIIIFTSVLLFGCATKPVNAPTLSGVTATVTKAQKANSEAQTATQEADAKAQVILDYLNSHP